MLPWMDVFDRGAVNWRGFLRCNDASLLGRTRSKLNWFGTRANVNDNSKKCIGSGKGEETQSSQSSGSSSSWAERNEMEAAGCWNSAKGDWGKRQPDARQLWHRAFLTG
eukprot:EG_transcript_30132